MEKNATITTHIRKINLITNTIQMSGAETSLENNSLSFESHDYQAQKIRLGELDNSLKTIQIENANHRQVINKLNNEIDDIW